MNEHKDLREFGQYSNDTTKAVLEILQKERASSDWSRAVTVGLSRVWRGFENQNYVDDVLAALEENGRADEVVAWAFSDANDDLLGAGILAAWAFQRSGSRRVIQIVARRVQTMPLALRASFTAFYRTYLEKAAWKLSGSGAWACHPDDAARERKEQAEQRENNRRFCEANDIDTLVGSVALEGNIPTGATGIHDIFISYRRDGGEHLAGRVKDALERRGFSAFLDVEDLKSGKFNEALLRKIEDATDFIVILTPGCLERCKNDGDWLRREIRHAIQKERNVVPIMARGFEMPLAAALPDDIADLPEYNGLTPAHELFEASIDRLVSKYLKAAKKDTATATAAAGAASASATAAERFTRFFAERPDVIAEVEAEATRTGAQTVANFEKLLLRLEVYVREPFARDFDPPNGAANLDRILRLIEMRDADNEAGKAFVLASRQTGVSYDQWRGRLKQYQREIGSAAQIREAIASMGTEVLPLVCASFRRMNSSDGHNALRSGFNYTGWIESELLRVMSRWKDFRALPFIADAVLRHADKMSGHNDYALATVQAVQAFGVPRQAIDDCFERLVGISASEILREKRDKDRD